MKPLPCNADLLTLAPRVIWFEEPEKALSDPIRFLAYVMTYGTPGDIAVIRRYVGDEGFQEVIENPPAGVMDERSWAYWNAMAGNYPAPPLPIRHLPD